MYVEVYKKNGLNCVDMNGTQTYLPDDLSLVGAVEIEGNYFIPTVIVNISI